MPLAHAEYRYSAIIFIASFDPQGGYRIQPGRAARSQHTGQKANHNGHSFGQHDKGQRGVHRQRGHCQVNELGQAQTQDQAEGAPQCLQGYRLSQKQAQNRASARAQSDQQANLPGALAVSTWASATVFWAC